MYNVIHKTNGKEKPLFDDEQNDLALFKNLLETCDNDRTADWLDDWIGNQKKSKGDEKSMSAYTLSKENAILIAKKMEEEVAKGINKMANEISKVVICTSKKYVIYGKEKVQCHEQDEFDWKIGLGLAISHSTNSDFKRDAKININDYRYKVIEKDSKGKILNTYKEFDYKEYANKILKKYLTLAHQNYESFVKAVNLALEKKENICFSLTKWEEDLKRIIKKEEK